MEDNDLYNFFFALVNIRKSYIDRQNQTQK